MSQLTKRPHHPGLKTTIRRKIAELFAGSPFVFLVRAILRGQERRPFVYKPQGLLAGLGRREAVAEIYGLKFSGFAAWWLWRTVYLLKLPGTERKVRVALDWTLDLFFPRDIVYLRPLHAATGPSAVLVAHDDAICDIDHAACAAKQNTLRTSDPMAAV